MTHTLPAANFLGEMPPSTHLMTCRQQLEHLCWLTRAVFAINDLEESILVAMGG
jgi:hypothetical protein